MHVNVGSDRFCAFVLALQAERRASMRLKGEQGIRARGGTIWQDGFDVRSLGDLGGRRLRVC